MFLNCAGAGLPGWGRGVSGSFRSTVHCAGAGLAGWGRGVSGSFRSTVTVPILVRGCGVSGSFRSTVTVPILLVPGFRGVGPWRFGELSQYSDSS